MADVVQGLLFRARSQTSGATRDLRGILSIMADLNGAISLVQRGLRGMTMIFREGVGASIEQERVFLRLDRALRGLNTTYEESQERLSSYFAEVQRTTRFGDDVTAEVMGRVATATRALGVGVDQLEEMTSLVLDYSEATGRDAVSSSRALSQVFAGNVEMLARMVPAYRDAVREIGKIEDPAERSAAAMAILNEEFGGAAENIDPLDLAFERIQNGLGDIREAMGDLVRQSPAMQEAFAGIADMVDLIASSLGGGSESAEGFRLALESVTVGGVSYIRALGEQLVNLWRVARNTWIEAQNMFGVGAGEERERNEALNAVVQDITEAASGPAGNWHTIPAIREGERAGVIAAGTADALETMYGGSRAQRQQATRQVDDLIAELERQREASGWRLGAQVMEEQAIDDALAALATTIGTGYATSDASGNPLFAPREQGDSDTGDVDAGGSGGDSSLADRLPGVMSGLAGRGKEDLTPLLDSMIERMQVLPEAWIEFGDAGVWAMDRIAAGLDNLSGKMQAEQEAARAVTQAAVEDAKANAELIAGINTDFASAMQTMVGDVTADALVSMSDAIVAGGDSLEAFGGTVLASLTKIAKGIGATYIATGIPMLIPGPLFNPAAGGAYLKYGGLLLGGGTVLGLLSGGGGGGAGAGSAPEAAMRSQSQARPIERTTVNATYIDTVVTEDERTMRNLSTRMDQQHALGSGRL